MSDYVELFKGPAGTNGTDGAAGRFNILIPSPGTYAVNVGDCYISGAGVYQVNVPPRTPGRSGRRAQASGRWPAGLALPGRVEQRRYVVRRECCVMTVAEARETLRRVEAALAVAVSRKRGWLAPDDLQQMRIDALHQAVDKAKRALVAGEIAELVADIQGTRWRGTIIRGIGLNGLTNATNSDIRQSPVPMWW